ncbi:FAD binding domain-containing protein [Apiospora phragmitis]|uniref:FAD binding domain-containing protein n=1 Tax=Apiospora phragmitis TaxID=2905665 RepID=A0ABR1T9A4_9PEZI
MAFESPLHVLIVGGGLSGLATTISVSLAGHKATVFEAAPQPHPFGSGVLTCPKRDQAAFKMGDGGVPEAGNNHTPIARWQLCDSYGAPLSPDLWTAGEDGDSANSHQKESQPPLTFHRVDLQAALLHRAQEVGATVRFGARVTSLDDEDDDGGVTIQLESGAMHCGDLVVIAEGTNSRLRNIILDRPVDPAATRYVAYRITVDRFTVHDPALLAFMDAAFIRTWVGNGSYVSAFPMKRGAQLSMMVLIPHNQLLHGATTTPTDELGYYFKDWDVLLSSMIDAAQRVNKWTAVHLPELPENCSPQGTSILVGDAANTMSPFLSQGLSLDLEDAATIGCLLGHVRSVSQLPAATALYVRIRNARAQRMREETVVFESQLRATTGGGCRNDEESSAPGAGSSCPRLEIGRLAQTWMWSYDAYAEAEAAFRSEPF